MRYIKLSKVEERELSRLLSTSSNSVVCKRSKALLMSNMEIYSMQEIAKEVGVCRTTLYHLFNRWESSSNRKDRFEALNIGKGRGTKPKLDFVKGELPNLFEKYNGKINVILRVLEEKYGITVCPITLRKYLKEIPKVK